MAKRLTPKRLNIWVTYVSSQNFQEPTPLTIRKESEIIVPEIAKEKEIGDVEVTPETSDIVDSKVDNTRVIITFELLGGNTFLVYVHELL